MLRPVAAAALATIVFLGLACLNVEDSSNSQDGGQNSDNNNNSTTATTTGGGAADLVIKNVTLPSSTTGSAKVNISGSFANIGGTVATDPGSLYIRAFVSTNTTVNSSDTYSGFYLIQGSTDPAQERNFQFELATSCCTMSWPGGTGTHYVAVAIDCNSTTDCTKGRLPEANENNNWSAVASINVN